MLHAVADARTLPTWLPTLRIRAMSSRHSPGHTLRGCTFEVTGTLTGSDGLPLDLGNGAALTWAMRPELGGAAIELPGPAGLIEVTDPQMAAIKITLSAAATAARAPGRYVDELRVTLSEVVSTLWTGAIVVDDSPFEAAA